jgi:opine dehydrogenase
MLLSGKMGGCMEFEHIVKTGGYSSPSCLIEGDSIYACRKTAPDAINIRGKKEWVLISGTDDQQTQAGFEAFSPLFKCLYPADNFIQRGLSDLGAYVHPVVMLLNCGSIERGESFLFYRKGVTEAMRGILSAMDEERSQIAQAYNTTVKSLAEMVRSYYPETPDMGGDIIKTLQACPTYKNSISPDTINHRYLMEDVLMSLYPARLLAKRAGVGTPAINAMIEFAKNLIGLDTEKDGRTPEKMGIKNSIYEHLALC